MNRREFLALGGGSLLFTGCDSKYFQASPYEIITEESGITNANLNSILSRSAKTNTSFKVAVVSDTHNFYDEFTKVQNKIRERRDEYSFLIHAGDITDQGLRWEYEHGDKILREADLPYLTVIGNHDALTNGRGVYGRLYGAYNYSLEYNGAKFIFLNNNNWEFGDAFPDTQWLESQLGSSDGSQPIIIVCHIPPLQEERFTSSEIEKFKNLMSTYNVEMVINGHNHGHVAETVGGTTYLTNGTVEGKIYCEVSVTYSGGSHTVSYEKISI
ncbi:MAG: metallophosphoesterase [Campylobacterales bacterium]|nr:metallophosphoesterase [Campylobacterales bacterium]